MKTKTPQEKKALSYAKDRRNAYGENDKSSRKNIPLRKAKSHRSYRKKVNDILHKTLNVVVTEDVEIVENEVKSVRKNNWKKYPDKPLGEFVKEQLSYRKRRENKGKTLRKKIREIVENLEIKTEQTATQWVATATNFYEISAVGETQEKAVHNLIYVTKATVSNSFGLNHTILLDGKLIKPIL